MVEAFNQNMSNEEISMVLTERNVNSITIRLSKKGLTSRSSITARENDSLVGRKYGLLTVRQLHEERSKSGSRLWLCDCDCGGVAIVPAYHLKRNNVRSCGCLKKRENNPAWRGYKEIGSAFWGGYERAARTRNIPFELTIEEGWDLYLKQDRKCYFTGYEIEFSLNSNHSRCGTASLDRLDSHKGYSKENCVWVHKDINRFKNNYSVEQFLKMCYDMANHGRLE